VDVKDLQDFAQLDGHVERQWNHHLQDDDVRPENPHALHIGSQFIRGQIGHREMGKRAQPHSASNSANNAQYQQNYHTPEIEHIINIY